MGSKVPWTKKSAGALRLGISATKISHTMGSSYHQLSASAAANACHVVPLGAANCCMGMKSRFVREVEMEIKEMLITTRLTKHPFNPNRATYVYINTHFSFSE
jgi:hypothetical protein